MPTTTCTFCTAELPARFVAGPHWNGTEYVTAAACNNCRCSFARAARPARPARRTVAIDAGGWGALGAGRKAARG